jgi:3-deoxy-D-manno-octulosonate 8-phosphate phosphatase (KDO 8-P phosphatase)
MPGPSVIKAIALDVDGVLTDGSFWWGPDGQEWKRFNFRDVMGISRAQKAGIVFALISGESSPLIDRFAKKMNITEIYKGCRDKQFALVQFAAQNVLALEEIAFMGDDINDLGAMLVAGLSAAPADAHPSVLAKAAFVAKGLGGHGAVRELVDHLLQTGLQSSDPTKK